VGVQPDLPGGALERGVAGGGPRGPRARPRGPPRPPARAPRPRRPAAGGRGPRLGRYSIS
jgi:hypothetical protein